jgi:hypothetical protein
LAYNKFCPTLQRVMDMGTSTRWMTAQHIFAKYKNHEGGPQRFLDCLFKKAEASDRITNRDGQWRGLPVNLDWLLKEENYIQVIEGRYDNGKCAVNNFKKPAKKGFQGISDDLEKAFS